MARVHLKAKGASRSPDPRYPAPGIHEGTVSAAREAINSDGGLQLIVGIAFAQDTRLECRIALREQASQRIRYFCRSVGLQLSPEATTLELRAPDLIGRRLFVEVAAGSKLQVGRRSPPWVRRFLSAEQARQLNSKVVTTQPLKSVEEPTLFASRNGEKEPAHLEWHPRYSTSSKSTEWAGFVGGQELYLVLGAEWRALDGSGGGKCFGVRQAKAACSEHMRRGQQPDRDLMFEFHPGDLGPRWAKACSSSNPQKGGADA